MRKTPLALEFAALILTLGPALAQAAPPTAKEPSPSQFLTQMPAGAMRISKLVGAEVIGLDHVKLGSIDEILLDRNGKAETAVIGAGGVLGVGGKRVAVPFDQLLWNTGDVSRSVSPGAAVRPDAAPSQAEGDAAGGERMPGARVTDEALDATAKQRSARVEPATGPITTGAVGQATTPVTAEGGAARAMLRMTKAQLESAPEFQYGR
jgi:hypothetical protein